MNELGPGAKGPWGLLGGTPARKTKTKKKQSSYMYHFDFKVWQSYFEVKMVHVRTQLEQLAPGQKCPGAQFMQFQWHTMSFIWQMAKWQKAKAGGLQGVQQFELCAERRWN